MFGFNQDELLCVPRVFLYILSVCGWPVTTIVFVMWPLVLLRCLRR